MKIIDAHMHLPVDYPTFAEKKHALLAEMKKNEVSKGVVISDSELVSSIGSMTDCARLFAENGNIAVVGGISPFINYDEQLKLLENYIACKMLVGAKIFCGHEPIYLNDDILKPVFNIAERYNVPVLFHSGWDDPQYSSAHIIMQTAEANPSIKLVCCHCCYPDLRGCFDLLAEYRNVYFDISSIADECSTDNKSILERAIRAMPDRFIFGSDFGCCSQADHVEFSKQLDISEHERELLLSKNAMRIYGIA